MAHDSQAGRGAWVANIELKDPEQVVTCTGALGNLPVVPCCRLFTAIRLFAAVSESAV